MVQISKSIDVSRKIEFQFKRYLEAQGLFTDAAFIRGLKKGITPLELSLNEPGYGNVFG